MPANPLARHPAWRQLAIVAIAVPVLVTLLLAAFAWPAGRLGPRDLPVGVVGSGPAASRTVGELVAREGTALSVRTYADEAAARHALEHRHAYGALEVGAGGVTVFVASAASASVAQDLEAMAGQVAASAHLPAPRVVDVVPFSADDPHGTVLGSSVLPLVFGGEIVAVVVALLLGLRPSWRQVGALAVVSATVGLAAYLIAQGWLGALPGLPWATWAALAGAVFAISTTTAGLYELIGVPGIGLTAALMIFLGNPFSGATSAPELLPEPVGWLGRLLPPGAANSLLRSTAYFDGNGATGPAVVLGCWTAFGVLAIVVGHKRQAVRAARRAERDRLAEQAHPGHEPHHLAGTTVAKLPAATLIDRTARVVDYAANGRA